MSIQEPKPQTAEEQSDIPREDWGNGLVVISNEEETGSWVMFDPEEDEVDLSNWR